MVHDAVRYLGGTNALMGISSHYRLEALSKRYLWTNPMKASRGREWKADPC